MPPHAVQEPIAAPRSDSGKTATMIASEAGVSSAPGDALQRARDDQQLDRRRQRADQRGDAEAGDAEREHAPLAVEVGERAGDEDQGASVSR